jgi:hypothetical protein
MTQTKGDSTPRNILESQDLIETARQTMEQQEYNEDLV